MKLENVCFAFVLLLSISFTVEAQRFEGTIKYKSESTTDTAYLTYNIRENLIRLDEADHLGAVHRSTIVNLENKSVTAIDPNKKLYTDIYPKPYSQFQSSDFEIKRMENTKVINGYVCYQWRVKNRAANTEVAYWIAEGDFEFYEDLLKTIPITENTMTFFLSIPQPDRMLPLHVCERTLLRDVKNTFHVMEINEKPVDASLFQIPVGYEEFQASR